MDRIDSHVEGALRRLGITAKVREVRAREAWLEVLGPGIAADTRPLHLRRGVLTVVCESAALRHQLTLDRLVLLERLARLMGPGVVRDVKLRASE